MWIKGGDGFCRRWWSLVGVWLKAGYVRIRETTQKYFSQMEGEGLSRSSLFHTQQQHTPSANMIKWYFSSDTFQFTFSDSETPKNRPYLAITASMPHLWLPIRYPKRNTSYVSDPRNRTWSEGSMRIGLISVSLRDKPLRSTRTGLEPFGRGSGL